MPFKSPSVLRRPVYISQSYGLDEVARYRNILDHWKLFDLGFNVYATWKRPLTHV